jgi:FkbM family methyltransferase
MNHSALIPDIVRHYWKYFSNPVYREFSRLSTIPAYTPSSIKLFDTTLLFADARSFAAGYKEIFINRHYEFKSTNDQPVIIDCGANVGLSVIFFKHLYPKCKITAFEPDPVLFSYLERNIASLNYENIKLYQKAIWTENGNIDFLSEGGFSGKISKDKLNSKTVSVQAVRLSDFLQEKIDFLKIDVEGVETEILEECAHLLKNISFIFIEYHSTFGENQSLHEILTLLSESGFRYHLKDAYTADKPFVNRPLQAGMDFQTDIFAFKE